MFVRRCGFLAFWLVLALYVLRHPLGAAQTVAAIGSGLASLADALAAFASVL
ncbi:hypothetical protein SAMN04489712_12832 [Thermomonospora echinospora]|uniref:Uncharacterized protein n=1 Tax=Thermomonospora echinospora TaxID=1992 RepID=A0A1H6E0M8_9ACTN|nr:hypothetical protein [Thermomonospora echinospora]SEG91087.1 hypothetical protein SAMN04489712_12832 [Thermomonospora echinospora]